MKKNKFYYWLIKKMSKKLKYLIAIDVIAYSTSGKYGNTIVPEITAMEVVNRYGRDFNIY